jgi:tetratricopeptide (TPR) repeat protein
MLGWLKRGDTYRRRGDYQPALRDSAAGRGLDPTARAPSNCSATCTDAWDSTPGRRTLLAVHRARRSRAARVSLQARTRPLPERSAAAALEPLQKASPRPADAEAYYLLGLCERDTRHADAAAAFTRAWRSNPAFSPAARNWPRSTSRPGRRRALEQLERSAALEPVPDA